MKRLTELRKEKDLSMAELAKELVSKGYFEKISDSTISNYENGKRYPNIEKCKYLAKFFNVTPQYLMGWTDEPH